MGRNFTDYSDYRLTKKATHCLKQAIKKHDIDIRQPFDLFLVTEHIERCLNYNEMQYCRLFTTGEVTKAIEYMAKNNLDRD